MFENCSQATFVKENLLGLLGLLGRKTSITIKAINGEVMKTSKKLQNLEYSKASHETDKIIWVTLPSPYSQNRSTCQ